MPCVDIFCSLRHFYTYSRTSIYVYNKNIKVYKEVFHVDNCLCKQI